MSTQKVDRKATTDPPSGGSEGTTLAAGRSLCRLLCTKILIEDFHNQPVVVDSLVCLLFYVLTTSKVISGWVSTCDSAHYW